MPNRAALPRICIALGFPTVSALLEHARKEVEAGETFVEFRLDYLPNPREGVKAIRTFLERNQEVTILATCRRHQNHGKFNGSVEEEVRILQDAVNAGARAVDLEIESAETHPPGLEQLRSTTQLLVSYHNFDGTPQMEPVLRRMLKVQAHGYKIVTTARKPSDSQRVLALAKSSPRTPLILLAMGEHGFATRVLSPSVGGLYTYAAPLAAEGTAGGQVCARQLRQLYRVEKVGRSARIFGVIADPVRHSISPQVHNRAFQARRVDAVYLPFLVHPVQLKDFFQLAEKLPIAGASVTIPHKQKVMRYLDVVEPLARRIGAVNTIWKKGGRWRGTNTDAAGVVKPLSKRLRLGKSSVLIVGNGGAARSAAWALADQGAKVAVTGRNPDRVRAFARLCGAEAILKEQLDGRHFDAMVHSTPVGMWPNVNETPFPGKIPAEVVFDLVYTPMETKLLKEAKSQGKTIVPGIEMFLEQAVAQFEIWTEETAPRSVMEKAALEALQQK
jgi:3-dehydroquinate dehydratase / shikimate dehydrogenase